MRIAQVGFVAVTVAVLLTIHALAVTTSYHIGNSLTQDSQPEGVVALADSRGLDHQVGYHILSSASLNQILANPNDVSIEPTSYGKFQQALPNNAWDIVTIQPHPSNSPLVTLEMDTQSILSFINLTRSNPANQETNFYIYQGWPQISSFAYSEKWVAASPDLPDTQMSRTREYYQHLIERVRSATDANVYMVPTGEVFHALDLKMRAGELPGFNSVYQFYRDASHMDSGKGRFVASVTTFATILGQYPNELEKPEGTFGSPTELTPTQTAIILETIREVLDSDPYSGVEMPEPLYADFNDDNVVDEVDLQMLLPSIGVERAFDSDLNGTTNGRDFLYWQRNYKSVPSGDDLAKFLISDLNGDGIFDAGDLEHWHDSYGANGGADVDGDGDTDGRDFLKWQRAQPNNLSDWNRDYLVDSSDLAAWQNSYGYHSSTDANGDGAITTADYDIWVEENGRTWTFPYALSAPPLVSQSSDLQSLGVPEPTCFATLVGTMLILTVFRWNLSS